MCLRLAWLESECIVVVRVEMNRRKQIRFCIKVLYDKAVASEEPLVAEYSVVVSVCQLCSYVLQEFVFGNCCGWV